MTTNVEGKLDEIAERWKNIPEWSGECMAGGIRHLMRNVDHDSYCSCTDETAPMPGRYDGATIAKAPADIEYLLRLARLAVTIAETVKGLEHHERCNYVCHPPEDCDCVYGPMLDALHAFNSATSGEE